MLATQATLAKIRLPKKTHGLVWTYRDLSSQADPVMENWTWSYPYLIKTDVLHPWSAQQGRKNLFAIYLFDYPKKS